MQPYLLMLAVRTASLSTLSSHAVPRSMALPLRPHTPRLSLRSRAAPPSTPAGEPSSHRLARSCTAAARSTPLPPLSRQLRPPRQRASHPRAVSARSCTDTPPTPLATWPRHHHFPRRPWLPRPCPHASARAKTTMAARVGHQRQAKPVGASIFGSSFLSSLVSA
jgi:hypothetical protein